MAPSCHRSQRLSCLLAAALRGRDGWTVASSLPRVAAGSLTMSTLTLQVGQAGNQLGAHFWTRAVHHAQELQQQQLASNPATAASPSPLPPHSCLPLSPFFSSSGHARALLIDTEPKVLAAVQALSADGILAATTSTRSLFHRDSLFFDQYGRGNNWALGYAGRQVIHTTAVQRPVTAASRGKGDKRSVVASNTASTSANEMSDAIMERLRVEAERMDVFDSVVMMHSLGGGTGSGLGSLLAERIKDSYSRQTLLSVSVLPFARGETPLQHYNTTLALDTLYQQCDAVMLFDNDTVLELLTALSTKGGGGAGKGAVGLPFAVMNSYIADCLCDVLLPSGAGAVNGAGGGYHSLSSLPSLLATLCPLPSHKLLDVWTTSGLCVPSAHDPMNWSTLIDTCDRTTQHYMRNRNEWRVLEYAVVARGEGSMRMEAWDKQRLDERIGRHLILASSARQPPPPPPSNNPRLGSSRVTNRIADHLTIDSSRLSLSYQAQSLAVLVNHGRLCGYVRGVVEEGRRMYARGSYVHWYEKFGCGRERFEDAFERVERIATDYEQWTKG